jgi:hypothetical protein
VLEPVSKYTAQLLSFEYMEWPKTSPAEKEPLKSETIPTQNDVFNKISDFVPVAKTTREVKDGIGLAILEMRDTGESEGTFSEFIYTRKGVSHAHSPETETSIRVAYYENGIPVGGTTLALWNEETGEWENHKS